jgi:hypothetical protein
MHIDSTVWKKNCMDLKKKNYLSTKFKVSIFYGKTYISPVYQLELIKKSSHQCKMIVNMHNCKVSGLNPSESVQSNNINIIN